ncbi:hypothetical protein SAMN05421768_103650 [Chryseobacterium joostei]|uniref:Uncharacterized protein n=1 Tax=Chryseobacterium joostei TaxID=112234 RepID=A0A1N7IAX3_9FLAO|nr:hypothetical protein [Chryseobacterium joostei]SIS34218.1 hypothetical protein SAMN05421768_103650 [Chryseobacterium joostei]
MKKIHRKRSWKKIIIDNKKDNLTHTRQIHDATLFQEWFAKMGGLIESDDMEKVIEKFK